MQKCTNFPQDAMLPRLMRAGDLAYTIMPTKDDQSQNWGRFVGVGLEIGVGVALGYVIGSWLDRRFGWSPWGVVAATSLGLAAGLYLLIKEALKMNKD